MRTICKAELKDRSTLKAWIKYMLDNPIYFYQVSGKKCTPDNISSIAIQLFDTDVRLYKDKTKHYHNPRIIKGLSVIGEYVGVSGKTISNYYSIQARNKLRSGEPRLPVWREHGEYIAHKGRLVNWAKKKRIGKYRIHAEQTKTAM